ncbi:GNAT family N-acetyltransferase [Hirschia litorea]|uniref:GNAT family N-acetyltransferase n=1 Tax=Hirschia litorea TaxID=1199156 RepID=A0ABW2IMH7_9PROT
MTYHIEILPSENADLDSVGQLIFDSIHGLAHTHYSKEQLQAWAPEPYAGDAAKMRFAGQILFTASDDSGLAAIMSLTSNAHLDFAYTHPRCSGKGAASQTYSTLETYALAHDVQAITSDVSLVARPFFEKRGFKILAQNLPVKNGVGLTNFSARKDLI